MKQTTRLIHGLLYRSVASALNDNGDLLAELAFIQKSLRPRSVVTYKYLNLDDEKSPPIPTHYIG